MIRLFISYYKDENEGRQKEIDFCLKRNIDNIHISEIILLNQTSTIPFKHFKIKSISDTSNELPTFSKFFKIINENVNKNDISILSNADIFFDETIEYINNIRGNELYALLRWEYNNEEKSFMHGGKGPSHDSQDSWIWRGKMIELKISNIQLGRLGCDNRIAWEFNNKGYKVKNPSKTIKSYHVHTKKRKRNKNMKISTPYRFIKPHYLE